MTEIAHKIISPVNIKERRSLDVRPGDTVRVSQKIQDKGKTRIQVFEGLVLARKHGKEAGSTFTVRRSTGGIAVEKIFPLYSPMIDKIEILKRAKVRRAKLYYIRDKAAKQIRRQMRRSRFMDLSTESDIEAKANTEKAESVSEDIEGADDSTESPETTSQETPSTEEISKEEPTKEDQKEEKKKEE